MTSTTSRRRMKRTVGMVLLAMAAMLLAMPYSVAAAEDNTNADDTNTDDNNNNNNNDNATATETTAASASASSTTASATCGSSPGAFEFTYPYSTTIGVVGSVLELKWEYSEFTNTDAYPADSISLYYQDSANGISSTNWKNLASNIARNAVGYNWTIPSLTDSTYKVRINADGVDPTLDTSVSCVPDGFPSPSNTQAFHIVNALPLGTSSDSYGPHSGADSLRAWGGLPFARILTFSFGGSSILAALTAGGLGYAMFAYFF